MDLKKLLAETMELSGMSSEIPNIVAEDPSESMTEEQLEDEDTQSEASPDAQDAREQELPELSTAQPDEHQEANLSIPELFDEDTQSEASPDAQDAREQELPELSTAQPDEHQEANLSIPELFDEDTQQLEVRHPNPEGVFPAGRTAHPRRSRRRSEH